MSSLPEVTEATFAAEVERVPGVTVVDLWATWCVPCRAIAPMLEQVAAERGGKVRVVKLNADDHPKVPMRFNVRGVPTLLVFRDGALVDRVVGAMPKAHVDQVLDRALA